MAKHGFDRPKVELHALQKMVLRLPRSSPSSTTASTLATSTRRARSTSMMNEAFQEEGEAVGKWRRACLSSAQLTTYYFGFTEMMRLRREAQVVPGFTERAWHDRLLSFASPPPRHVRTLLARRPSLPPPR